MMTRNSILLSSNRGLTLIEIMIAMFLLAFISLAVFQTTSRSFEVNAKLGTESTDSTAILLSLQAVESDLAQIYSPMLGALGQKPDDKKTTFWSGPLRPDGFRRSRLMGTAEKISFIANNNRRVEADSPQSDFQRITWEVERNNNNTFTLFRTTDWDVFHYEEGTAHKPPRVALLDNLSSAKFTYYRKANKTWEDHWDSEDSYSKDESRFPELISLKVEAPNPVNSALQLPWEIVVRPNLPMNILDAKAKAALRSQAPE